MGGEKTFPRISCKNERGTEEKLGQQEVAADARVGKDRTLNKYRVYYNLHLYGDLSGRPKSASRIVKANSPDEAREKVRELGQVGRLYIGMVFDAELIKAEKVRQ